MKLSQTGTTLSSTQGAEDAGFRKEFAHPEMKNSMAGGKDSGELITPVSGPNPATKQVTGPVGTSGVPPMVGRGEFQLTASYEGPGNAEMQGKPMADKPLNDFSRGDAKITNV